MCIRDRPGIVDKKLFKKLKVTVDIAEEIGCEVEDVNIDSFHTYQQGNRFGIRSNVTTSNECLITAIKSSGTDT